MIQKAIVFFSVLLGMGNTSLATPGDITPIEGANLICVYGDGGMIAINATDERVWQGDPGDTEALELQVVQFNRFRCPNAYDIQAKLIVFGEEADVRLTTTSCGSSDVSLEYKIGEETLLMDCRVQ